MTLYRPLAQSGSVRPSGAVPLAGGPVWFTHAEQMERGAASSVIAAAEIPGDALDRLSAPRASIAGLTWQFPRLMGILNVTPDSFSDGGLHAGAAAAEAALAMQEAGADLIDIGGESTRPGAQTVETEEENLRVEPVVAALAPQLEIPMSVDTRKAAVAEAALDAGAVLINDVSGFTFDPALAPLCAARGVPVCVMHAQGDPASMQKNPVYDDVVQDVYAFFEARVAALTALGLPRDQIIIDPGIGFGKTLDHNLTLLRNLSVFHGLGCAILLGVSRKRFIGAVGDAPLARARAPGSLSVGLAALAQAVQILRVHDVAEHAQAIRLWRAVHGWD